jgi:hypothetical protein
VVDAHRGDVRIDSRPGDGTTVVVSLPVSQVADSTPATGTSEASEVSDTSDAANRP